MGAGIGMMFSLAGLIGAAVGLYIGWLDWKILKGILQAVELKNREAGGDGGVVARYRAPIGALIFIVPVIGFPIVGYWAASALTA